MRIRLLAAVAAFLVLLPLPSRAGDDPREFTFTAVTTIPTTPVEDQARTNTCWSFATLSFVETELLRAGREAPDLSEMYVVRRIYPEKALNYVRRQGAAAFGEGSLAGDALRAVRRYGMMPESAYVGAIEGQARPSHAEVHAALKGFLDGLLTTQGSLTPAWPRAFDAALDAYLGAPPERFDYQGRTFTPLTFAQRTGFDADQYVELTSFTHHPFYERVNLEIPDNWAGNTSWNVPLDELMAVMDHALENGYSVLWDGDVSERSFCHRKGVAVLPQKGWDERTEAERTALCDAPEPERDVTQDLRQQMFEDHSSTDDHLMHLTGLATDQDGRRYYRTKNSWGTVGSRFDGFLYMSGPYVRAKTISIVVHRDALPSTLKARLKA